MITRRFTFTALACAALFIGIPAMAQQAARPQRPAQDPALAAAIQKSNAYIALMNRTLRASQSWERYTSWVNVKTGPTGRERYISYGLYSLYDVRSEIEKALAATKNEPKVPELDALVESYVAAYQALSPLITQANGYYDRQDYKADNMAEGKALHAKLVPAAEAFLAQRAKLDGVMRGFKRGIDERELAALETAEGKKGRWHVKNVMMGAQEMVELLPSDARPVVDMATFDPALARFAVAVRAFDEYVAANPDEISGFNSQPASLLGRLRNLQTKLQKAKGDARRGGGDDLTWIVNDYNMMITLSSIAIRTRR